MQDIKKILELRAQNRSQRFIAQALLISRNTVRNVFKLADEKGIYWCQVKSMDELTVQNLIFGSNPLNLVYVQPDFDYVHKELLKPGVTLNLLWEEYCEKCRSQNLPSYQRSNFYRLYNEHVKKNNLTMHINHKPGDRMMVDWDGKTMNVTDRYTGEVTTAYIFVATLPFSMYSYIQACSSMDSKNWIDCHVKAFNYFDGVPRLLIPDNLKTGVIQNKKYEDPILNKSYQEMADHYKTTIIPARVKAPKDKAAAEGTVGVITTAIVAKLRNRTFFSFDELNKVIHDELEKFNSKPFQKKEGSRKSIYFEEEKDFMMSLPEREFELSEWKTATVQLNYHVSVDRMNYSVPYEYVGKRVEVKMTRSEIEIFYKGNRISSHKRLYGRKNQYSTTEDHMPENHKLFTWNGERFRKWAVSIGPNTFKVIDIQLKKYKVEEQAYKGCLSLLKLSDKYTGARLEKACQLALEHISEPGYKNIRMILESGQDKKTSSVKENDDEENLKYACMRGKEYYGGIK